MWQQHRFLGRPSLACPGAAAAARNLQGRKRERVRAGGLRAELVHRDHGAGSRARRPHLRSRRRGLRDRRRAGRPDRRARGRAARLVGRGAGGRAHRLERVRAQRRLRAARLRRVDGPGREPGRHRSRQGAVGAVRRRPRICAQHDPRHRHAGRRSGRRLAQGLEDRQRRSDDGRSRALRSGARAEIEGWPAERVREVLKTNHYFHALHLPRAFHIHPLNYALGLAAAAELGGARIFENTPRALDRRRGRAQADRDAARARARRPYRAGVQRSPRRLDAEHRRHAGADLGLRGHHRAARGRGCRRRSPIAAR